MSSKLLLSSYFLTLILLLLLSCKSNFPKDNEEMLSKESWETDYKSVTFIRCIFLGLNKSEEIRNVLKMDRSTHQDFAYGLNEYKFIDSIVKPVIQQAKIDSANHYKKYLEGFNEIERDELNGLPIFRYCLDFCSSDEFKILATERVDQMEYLWKK